MYKLVIFDFDGTIADTSLGIINSVKYVQKKMVLPQITRSQLYSHIGPPMEESYQQNFGLTGEKLKQAVFLHKEYAVRQGYRELEVYDGIPELLEQLHSIGVHTAIATLKAQTTAEKILEEFHLADAFDMVIGSNSEKPMTKAQMLTYCMEQFTCKQPETVLIGDSKYDAVGAEQADIPFIAVTYGFGFGSEQEVSAYKHVSVCENVTALTDFIICQTDGERTIYP